jgi:hypothetical protein
LNAVRRGLAGPGTARPGRARHGRPGLGKARFFLIGQEQAVMRDYQLNIRLTAAERSRLNTLAEKLGISPAETIRLLIKHGSEVKIRILPEK